MLDNGLIGKRVLAKEDLEPSNCRHLILLPKLEKDLFNHELRRRRFCRRRRRGRRRGSNGSFQQVWKHFFVERWLVAFLFRQEIWVASWTSYLLETNRGASFFLHSAMFVPSTNKLLKLWTWHWKELSANVFLEQRFWTYANLDTLSWKHRLPSCTQKRSMAKWSIEESPSLFAFL